MSLRRNLALSLVISSSLMVSGCDHFMREGGAAGAELLAAEGPDVVGIQGTLLEHASSAEKKNDFARAQQLYAQLISYDKKNVKYQLAYANSARRAGATDAALKAYEEILSKHPKHIEALEGKGIAQFANNDLANATTSFSQVMKINSKRWKTLNALGLLFIAEGQHNDAMAYFTEALMQSPNNVSVLNNVGLTLAIQNENIDAIEALETASELVYKTGGGAAQIKHIDMNLAMVHGISGNMNAAKQVASRHLKGAELDNNLGYYAHLSKDDQLAKSYLNRALSKDGAHYEKAWKNLELISTGENRASGGQQSGTAKRVKVN